jgi:hypothetical protein
VSRPPVGGQSFAERPPSCLVDTLATRTMPPNPGRACGDAWGQLLTPAPSVAVFVASTLTPEPSFRAAMGAVEVSAPPPIETLLEIALPPKPKGARRADKGTQSPS